MPSQKESQRSSSHKSGTTSSTSGQPDSKHKIVKDSYGSRSNFQASFGLKMTPEDLEEGNAILEAFQKHDAASKKL